MSNGFRNFNDRKTAIVISGSATYFDFSKSCVNSSIVSIPNSCSGLLFSWFSSFNPRTVPIDQSNQFLEKSSISLTYYITFSGILQSRHFEK